MFSNSTAIILGMISCESLYITDNGRIDENNCNYCSNNSMMNISMIILTTVRTIVIDFAITVSNNCYDNSNGCDHEYN